MPAWSAVGRVFHEAIERAYELLPRGHYRGRGQDQSHTGASGQWLEAGPGRYLRRPRRRHEGRGPKGYVRDDHRILEDVCDNFTDHGDLDAADIAVEVEAGTVTLTGSVPTRYAKFLAANLALSVSGVKEVVNELAIANTGGPTDDSRSPIKE